MIDSLLADPGLEGHQVPMNTPMDTNARRTQLPPLMARGEHPVMPPSARGTLTFQGRRRSQNRADQRRNALTFVPPGQPCPGRRYDRLVPA